MHAVVEVRIADKKVAAAVCSDRWENCSAGEVDKLALVAATDMNKVWHPRNRQRLRIVGNA